MNEADTPKNEAFVEPLKSSNSPQPERASCPFYSVLPGETTASANIPLLAPAQDKECENDITSDGASDEDWVAEPDRDRQQMIDSEFKKLLVLNEELRLSNDDLYDQVQQLKMALNESEKAVEWQKKRSSVTESMLSQQAQELAAAQEQIKSLYQQLETATASAQRQESLVESYKAQLDINQQRLAQLERECALIQSNYNEQSHHLVQAETACRELRTRLMRQQRQTLQFKAALEKCLETPVPSYDSLDENDSGSTASKLPKRVNSLFTYTQPIKPWSGEQNLFDDDNPWEESPSPVQKGESISPNQPLPQDILDEEEEEILSPSQTTNTPEIGTVSVPDSSDLDRQLDGVIQMFFAANSVPVQPASPTEVNEDTPPAAETIWETTATHLVEEPEEQQKSEVIEVLPNHTPPDDYVDVWSEQAPVLELPETPVPYVQLMNESTNSNSPSPLIYPHRPPKGRKSLSSVELPKFNKDANC
ncbi:MULTISPECIES: hypothetical protein [Nostocales]|uniref:Uncharacterized protein n=3 Tax=Nostocales TaxID=1161 RepID=A0A0C1N741_9CYAN|nr:hypothetical protein [Tolypothrix bouteillei]KAF3885702.1 hypothetical protein DA73_0400009690 [Tolypothrix bouteillei VB521301]